MAQQPIPSAGTSVNVAGASDGLPRRFGRYTLLRRLATGGMAELFLALHRSVAGFEKLVVIKRVLPSMNQDEGFIAMLLHEARIAATLSHPNVVQIFDVGNVDGCYYIAMEHINGEDLRTVVRQMRKQGLAEFPLEHALSVVLGTCAGLAYAHEKRGLDGAPLNIVHRDVSPQNILVTYTGDVKVVDFGIAISERKPMGDDTRSGRLKGKVPYMSPEQARGEEIDWRSDIFSVGIILFELTTGKRLFKGANELETLRLICEREFPCPSQICRGYASRLESIVMRALARDRLDRYQSARELQADLESYVRDERIAVSEIHLSRWMQGLFEERIVAQKEALQDVKVLADIIAAQSLRESGNFDGLDIGSHGGHSGGSISGAAATLGSGGTGRRGRLLPAIAAGIGLLGIALGGYAIKARGSRVSPDTAMPVLDSAATDPKLALGSIRIESNPEQASIFINGDLRPERTPTTIDKLPLGTPLSIKVTKEGYAPSRHEVTLTPSRANESVVAMLSEGTVKLAVSCNVPDPVWLLDGRAVAGPLIAGLAANEEHRLTASAPGYQARSQVFMAGPNETKSLTFVLEKEKLGTKKAEDGGAVEPDPKGARPSASVEASEPPGGKPVVGSAGGDEPAVAKPVGNGRLNIGSRGGYCTVSVDGQSYGSTPVGGIALPAGTHRVSCQSDNGKAMVQTVKIEPDQTARVSFTLD